MHVYRWADLNKDQSVYRPGFGAGGTVTGETIEVGRYFYPKGHRPGRHSHAHEQIVTLLEGKIVVMIGDEQAIAGPGDVYRVPPNVPHNIEILEDAWFLSCKNLVDGQGSAAPRTWFETPHGGKGHEN